MRQKYSPPLRFFAFNEPKYTGKNSYCTVVSSLSYVSLALFEQQLHYFPGSLASHKQVNHIWHSAVVKMSNGIEKSRTHACNYVDTGILTSSILKAQR